MSDEEVNEMCANQRTKEDVEYCMCIGMHGGKRESLGIRHKAKKSQKMTNR